MDSVGIHNLSGSTEENLRIDDIPTIVEAVLDAMQAYANSEPIQVYAKSSTAVDVESAIWILTAKLFNCTMKLNLSMLGTKIKLEGKLKGLFCECHGRGQNSNKTCAVLQEAKCKYVMPLVLLH